MPVMNLQGTHEGLGAGANVVICGACDFRALLHYDPVAWRRNWRGPWKFQCCGGEFIAHVHTNPLRRDPRRPDGRPVDGCPRCTSLLATRARAGPFSAAASSEEEQVAACSDLSGDDDADGALSVEDEPGCEQRARVETGDAAGDGGADSD